MKQNTAKIVFLLFIKSIIMRLKNRNITEITITSTEYGYNLKAYDSKNRLLRKITIKTQKSNGSNL